MACWTLVPVLEISCPFVPGHSSSVSPLVGKSRVVIVKALLRQVEAVSQERQVGGRIEDGVQRPLREIWMTGSHVMEQQTAGSLVFEAVTAYKLQE